MCNAPICICIPVSQAPHGWLRVTKDQFFAWVGQRDIVYSVGKQFGEFKFRNRAEAGRQYNDTGDYYLLAEYARTVNHIKPQQA